MTLSCPRWQPPGVHWVAFCVDRVASLGVVMVDRIAMSVRLHQHRLCSLTTGLLGTKSEKFPLPSQMMVVLYLSSSWQSKNVLNRMHTKQRRNLLWFHGCVSFHGCFRYEYQLKRKLTVRAANCKVDSGFNSVLLETSSSFCTNILARNCVIYNLGSLM